MGGLSSYKVGDELERFVIGTFYTAAIVADMGEEPRWALESNKAPGRVVCWSTWELDTYFRRKSSDEGRSGCEAEREPDSPSPPNLEAALALVLGVAAMALGTNLDRISGAYRLSEGRIDIGLQIDGRPLHPSEAAEVEQALRAVRGSGGAREKPGEGKSISPKPQQPACTECGRTPPRRKLSWGSDGCRVCGRKKRRP